MIDLSGFVISATFSCSIANNALVILYVSPPSTWDYPRIILKNRSLQSLQALIRLIRRKWTRRQAVKYRIILKKGTLPEVTGFPVHLHTNPISAQYAISSSVNCQRSSFRHISFLSHFRADDVSHIDSRIDTRISNLLPRKRISSSKLVCCHIRQVTFSIIRSKMVCRLKVLQDIILYSIARCFVSQFLPH